MSIALWILIIVLGLVVFFGVLPTMILSAVLYTALLIRKSPEKWDRSCSIPDDEEYVRMFEQGLEWNELWKHKKQPVSVENDGLHLEGEYFDFGGDSAVIIIPGRMESCLYSYYFAEPYRQSGYNVLVIDNRAHGLSGGKISSLGFKEYRDIQAWARMLNQRFGNKRVILHGICIGSSAALFALTDPNCPDCLAGMVADGMYTTFYDSFRNHMIEDHHPNFPFTLEVMLYIRLISGANVVTDGPVKRIVDMRKPILFLHSREDTYSLPEKTERQLYDRCPAADKQLVWFDKGAHSRLRINAEEKYDRVIRDYLRATFSSVPADKTAAV